MLMFEMKMKSLAGGLDLKMRSLAGVRVVTDSLRVVSLAVSRSDELEEENPSEI